MSRFVEAPRTVVIAEDDGPSRELLQRQLESAGFQVVATPDGESALAAIRSAGGGIVIADWMMPRMDGVELCRTIRELTAMETLGFVYFILLTAHSDLSRVVEGLESGADDYLTKPYYKQELLARLRAGMRVFDLQEQLRQRSVEIARTSAEIVQLNARLVHLAMIDDLTGLYNRRAAMMRLDELGAHSTRARLPLGCIMCDIDCFKRVNDEHGHQVGDAVLRHTAGVLRGATRRYDVVARVGGEEFCVLCPSTAPSDLGWLAERIRARVQLEPFVQSSLRLNVTASFGCAHLCASNASPDALLSAADAMLYQAKRNGRNQVWCWTPGGVGTRFAAHAASPEAVAGAAAVGSASQELPDVLA